MNAAAMLVLALACSVMIGAAHAEPDPLIFLEKAERLQEKIASQLDGAPEETIRLYEEGSQRVDELRSAIEAGDADAAKEAFRSAMTAFKKISGEEWRGVDVWEMRGGKDPAALLERMQGYLEAGGRDGSGRLGELLDTASRQLEEGDKKAALETLREAMGAAGFGKHDPGMLKKAERLQEKIASQLDGAPDETIRLYEEGSQRVDELRSAIEAGDADAAKEAFRAAMIQFKGISGEQPRGAWDKEHDPGILLRIAERLQEKIASQLDGAPDETIRLYEEGSQRVDELRSAIEAGDADAAKEAFRAAMIQFKGISGGQDHGGMHDGRDISGLYERMKAYAESLEEAAKKQGMAADFAGINALFDEASRQISVEDHDGARQTLAEAKKAIKEIGRELRGEASEHGSKRSLAYAAKYIERLDAMIDGSGQDAERLRADLDAARNTLEETRGYAEAGMHAEAAELLRDLAGQLRGIKAALGS